MEIEIILLVLAIIWSLVSIKLFFKLWTACNDIRRIADKLDPDGKAMREPSAPKLGHGIW